MIVSTSLRHSFGLRSRCFGVPASRCCCQRGSKSSQKSSMAQKSIQYPSEPASPDKSLSVISTSYLRVCRFLFHISYVELTLTNVYTYLKTHEDHIHYEHFKAAGLPIGSGLVESACKWLIQQRFKGVGMRWSEAGFNHLLHLRLAWVNQQFDSF